MASKCKCKRKVSQVCVKWCESSHCGTSIESVVNQISSRGSRESLVEITIIPCPTPHLKRYNRMQLKSSEFKYDGYLLGNNTFYSATYWQWHNDDILWSNQQSYESFTFHLWSWSCHRSQFSMFWPQLKIHVTVTKYDKNHHNTTHLKTYFLCPHSLNKQ